MNIKHPTRQDIPALTALWKTAFGDSDEYLADFFAAAFAPERCLCAPGQEAACYWLDCSCQGRPLAYLYALATAPAHRGKGLCRGLMEEAKKVLTDRGYAGILLVPGSESLRQMYASMGFSTVTQIAEFSVTAQRPPCVRGAVSEADWGIAGEAPEESFTRLSPEAYAQARQTRLPADAVLEGPEFFALLAAQLEFYRWGDALFACLREGDHLFVPEYLGDPAQVPELLSGLGCCHATLRTPGPGMPWAMYCPLTDSPAPSHFSFALD